MQGISSMPLEIVGLIVQELSPRDLMNAHLAFSKDLKPSSKKIAFVIADTFYRNCYLHGSHLGLASSSQIIEDLITVEKKIKDSLKFGSISIKLNYKVDRTEIDWNESQLVVKKKSDSKIFLHSSDEMKPMKQNHPFPKNCTINIWNNYLVLTGTRNSSIIQVWTTSESPIILAQVLDFPPLGRDLKPTKRRSSIFGEILEQKKSQAILVTLDILFHDTGAIRTFSLPTLEPLQTIGFPDSFSPTLRFGFHVEHRPFFLNVTSLNFSCSFNSGFMTNSLLTLKLNNSGQTQGYQFTIPPGDRCFAMDVLPNGDVYCLAINQVAQKFEMRQFQFQPCQGQIRCEVNAHPDRRITLSEKVLVSQSGSWTSSDLESYESKIQLRFCQSQQVLILVLHLDDSCTIFGLNSSLEICFKSVLQLDLKPEHRVVALAVNSLYFTITAIRQGQLVIHFFYADTGLQMKPKPISVETNTSKRIQSTIQFALMSEQKMLIYHSQGSSITCNLISLI